MIEVSGIPVKENENCIDIIKRLGSLIGLNVNNSIEIAHRIKNAMGTLLLNLGTDHPGIVCLKLKINVRGKQRKT